MTLKCQQSNEEYIELFLRWINESNQDLELLDFSDYLFENYDLTCIVEAFIILLKDWVHFRSENGRNLYIHEEINDTYTTDMVLYFLKTLNKNRELLRGDLVDKKVVLNKVILSKNWVFE
jgi:hypothetical protein